MKSSSEKSEYREKKRSRQEPSEVQAGTASVDSSASYKMMMMKKKKIDKESLLGGLQHEDISGNSKKVYSTFDAMGLHPTLLRGIYSYGFDKPSAIQQRAIKPIMQGRDVIAQSQSGTGKTAVFSIGILQSIDCRSNLTQALALSPTRELAGQTAKVVSSIGDFMNVKCVTCVGGKAKTSSDDLKVLRSGAQVV